MRDLGLEISGQVDDVDGIEGAFLRADAAAYAQPLGDEGDFGLGRHFDAEFACSHDGTRLFAFLPAFLWFALLGGVSVWIRGEGLAL